MLKKKKKKINFWEPIIGTQEIKNIKKVLAMNWPNEGHFTKLLEEKIKKILGVKYAVCTTSGTASIFLSLKAVGVSSKHEVIIPDITFGATAMAASLTGAKIVLADVNKENLSFNLKELKKKINYKTKAIIPVHISGRGANIKDIKKIINRKKIFIIEDAAEALYSKNGNQFLGTIGDLGCFSLTASKTITTGQGGIIVTNNKFFFEKIKLLKNQGIVGKSDGGNVKHTIIGYNFKFTNLQAAMGLAQITSLKKRAVKLIKNNLMYRDKLKSVSEIKILNFNFLKGEVPLWTDVIAYKKRDKLINYLKLNGVECRKFWFPLHLQKPFKQSSKNFKVSSLIFKKLFWLPSSLSLNEKKITFICDLIKRFYNKNK
tara:strand:- start:3307 stop:4425 length:1119 start_codon:yes stop_codon:yes gene_type:complete